MYPFFKNQFFHPVSLWKMCFFVLNPYENNFKRRFSFICIHICIYTCNPAVADMSGGELHCACWRRTGLWCRTCSAKRPMDERPIFCAKNLLLPLHQDIARAARIISKITSIRPTSPKHFL